MAKRQMTWIQFLFYFITIINKKAVPRIVGWSGPFKVLLVKCLGTNKGQQVADVGLSGAM